MIRKTLLGCVATLVLLGTCFAPSAVGRDALVTSKWSPAAITFSGQRADWPDGSIGSLEDKEASLGLCNDSQNIYIMLFFRNPQWARTIKSGGLTVWLDPQGKKKKQFMVKLVGGPSWEELMKASGREPSKRPGQNSTEGDEQRQERRRADTAFTCFQRDYLVEKPIPLNGQEGPAATFAIDQGFFVYEFRVPLKESSVLYYGMGAKTGQTVSLGLLWGEVDQEKMRERNGGSDQGRGGGFGGGMGGDGDFGGMGGGMGRMGGGMGRRGGGRPGGFKMPEKQEVWLRTQLAASITEAAVPKK